MPADTTLIAPPVLGAAVELAALDAEPDLALEELELPPHAANSIAAAPIVAITNTRGRTSGRARIDLDNRFSSRGHF